MIQNTLRLLFCTLALLALVSISHAVTYTATLLHPDDFYSTIGNGLSNTSQVGQGTKPEFAGPHALLWTGSANSVVDLNGAYDATYATAATDTRQFGDGHGPSTNGRSHVLLWSGNANSVVDLNPAGFDVSYSHAIDGTHAVGYAFSETDFLSRAILWNTSPIGFTNLHPAEFSESFANGVSGDKQVGYGLDSNDVNHALLWSGTAESRIDLTPADFSDSVANDVYTSGPTTSKQVGSGASPIVTNSETHALLWSSSPDIYVDLHPTGYSFSEAIGISAAGQVGDGFGPSTFGAYHALYWNGNAGSVVDLHSSLFAGTGYDFISSQAVGIAANGNIVGTATDDGFNTYAILWTPVSSESGVAGDYNNNGKVDAGDYIAWRKGDNPLHNEVTTIGSNTAGDYTEWRTRFGNPPGSGARLDIAAIPEPGCYSLLATVFAIVSVVMRGAGSSSRIATTCNRSRPASHIY